MYVPKIFEAKSIEDVRTFVEKNGFATLISAKSGQVMATHTPLMIEVLGDEEFLIGHIARGNIQHNAFDGSTPLLVVFMNQHAYISSSWYDHINVPTWNYIAVHIEGAADVIAGEELKSSLHQLVTKYESSDGTGFSIDQMPAEMLTREMKGIVGFRMRIDKIEASYKLSQNRNEGDFKNIITKLKETGDSLSIQIAEDMEMIQLKSKSK